METVPIIRTPDELTGEWLAAALRRPGITLQQTERIGTGQMSQSIRLTFAENDGPAETVVVKLASDDPTSRATGVGMGAYSREVSLYRNLAPRLGSALPHCHVAEYDEAEGWFTIVLEDIVGAVQGDQIAGCSVDEARLALRELARVHAPVLGDLALSTSPWLNVPSPLTQELLVALLPSFLERYADRIAPEHVEVCERFVPSAEGWGSAAVPPLGLVHGDYRLDNLLYGNGTCKVVDWQTVTWGPVMLDAAYFIGGGLSVEDRRTHEEELIRLYHDELLAHGVQNFPWELCWEEYRRQVFHGILMTIAASMVTVRTDRGDDMFMTWLARNAQQVLDLRSLDLLPAPDAGRPEPLRPDPADEGRHTPGPEPLWNESWYFDAVSDDGTLGLYVRIGRVPNSDTCHYLACICGPDRPSIMLADDQAPLPAVDDDAQVVDRLGLHAEHHCVSPLQTFRVALDAKAQAHADPSAPLRNESGEDVQIAMDLTWETDGIPFAWRQSTRYEIPCRVTGTVRIGEEEIAFSGPGQRDHSWGARDWWASGWMWSGLHLQDGTHTHAVGVPQMPGFGVGYVQKGDEIAEITSVTATHEVADDELVSSARIVSGPDELIVDVEPIAYGAVRFDAPDGRVSFFPRAMSKVTTADGRTGVGWVEWNRIMPTGDGEAA